MQFVTFLLARLREASTYAGIATILASFGIQLADPVWSAAVQAAMALAGLAAALIPEAPAPAAGGAAKTAP